MSMKDCDEVLKRNRNHFGALSGYAQIYLQKGDLDRALTYFERALKVNPNLEGAAETVEQLQQKLQDKRRNTIWDQFNRIPATICATLCRIIRR